MRRYVFIEILLTQNMVDPKEHWTLKAEDLKNAGKFEEAIKIWYPENDPRDQLHIFEYGSNFERILVHTVGTKNEKI